MDSSDKLVSNIEEMENINKLEFHYYFNDETHIIDANIRNKCEAEVLAIIAEVSTILDLQATLMSEIPSEGGFRDVLTFIDEKTNRVTLLVAIASGLLGWYASYDPQGDARRVEKEKLEIQKLKLEIGLLENSPEIKTLVKTASNVLSNNRKINKRKSNLYSHLKSYSKVSKVGITTLTNESIPTVEENIVERKDFQKFIINSNLVEPIEIEDAEIEIVSPVLSDKNYTWKGIYNGEPISFKMLDLKYKNEILQRRIPFYTGSIIICSLRFEKILDELGDLKVRNTSVMTVLDTIEDGTIHQTVQGKAHRHVKSLEENQQDLFS